jgi:hypothetical protein
MRLRYLFEILLLLIVIAGFNIGRIFPESQNLGNIMAAICLLIWVLITLLQEDSADIKDRTIRITLNLTRILIAVTGIIFSLIRYNFFPKPLNKITPISEAIQMRDSSKCILIHYGIFKHDNDTIERLKFNNTDIEVHNRIDTFKLNWSDACSYLLIRKNGNAELFNIIDIRDNNIYMEKIISPENKEFISLQKINRAN